MKQFFAKFILAGNDDIKDGDYYIFDGKVNKCKKSIIPELKELYGDNWDSKLYQKVKLCICSRDIHAGDKVFCLDIHYNNFLHAPKWYIDPWIIRNAGDTCNACIKVIGEISSEAIWVKEGDEFDEDEIKIVYKNQYQCLCEKPNVYRTPEQATCQHMKDDYRGGDFCDRKIQVIDYIEILCPSCKKYH